MDVGTFYEKLEEAEMTAIDGLNENFRAANIPDDLRI